MRRALGVRTVFNLLGPLTNPAEPPFGLIGAYSRDAARLMAETLAGMPIERVFVVHGEPGWDEPTPCGPFELYDVRPGPRRAQRARSARLRPRALRAAGPCRRRRGAQRRGLRAVFAGEDRGPHRDALVLNAALVLEVTGAETRSRARPSAPRTRRIDRGDALRLLEKTRGVRRARIARAGRLMMGLLADMAVDAARSVSREAHGAAQRAKPTLRAHCARVAAARRDCACPQRAST